MTYHLDTWPIQAWLAIHCRPRSCCNWYQTRAIVFDHNLILSRNKMGCVWKCPDWRSDLRCGGRWWDERWKTVGVTARKGIGMRVSDEFTCSINPQRKHAQKYKCQHACGTECCSGQWVFSCHDVTFGKSDNKGIPSRPKQKPNLRIDGKIIQDIHPVSLSSSLPNKT